MQNFVKTIINAVQSWTKKEIKNSTADWNQNDTSAVDYVKNRTHWEELDGTIHKLDSKYLPDDIGAQADWNENDPDSSSYVKNRTHYKSSISEYICFEDYIGYGESKTVSFDYQVQVGTNVTQYIDGNILTTVQVVKSGDAFFAGDGRISVYFNNDNTITVYNYYANGIIKIVINEIIIDIKTLDDCFFPDTIVRNNIIRESTGIYSSVFNRVDSNIASGSYSHAEGFSTVASGDESHAEGSNTTASGYHSHAEGRNTTASGEDSHTEGNYTIATSKSQHVQGECNILDTEGTTITRGKYAHIVGNGTSDTARSNAHTLDWEGNAWYQGEVYVGGTAQDDENATRLLKTSELATEEDAMDLLAEIGAVEPVTASDGAILTSPTGEIYTL